jgi:hypothetical protein
MIPQNAAGGPMTDDDPWLNVPQAVVLEATRDIELVLDLTAETPALLQIKASWRLARRAVIPPEANPHPQQWGDTRKIFDEAKATLRPDYLEAQQQVNRRLAAGDIQLSIDQDRDVKAECVNAIGELANLLLVVLTGVSRIRLQIVDRSVDNFEALVTKLWYFTH